MTFKGFLYKWLVYVLIYVAGFWIGINYHSDWDFLGLIPALGGWILLSRLEKK